VGRLAVNFDPEILQLIRESKCLQRIGDQHVPEGAKMVLLQHDKFRSRADRLRFLVHEVDVVSNRIVPIMRAVLKPHLEWLQQKMQPGLVYLTWQSMNVSSYIESVEVAVKDFEELVAKVHDMTDHRIEGNLHYISLSNCISIPRDQSFTIEQFKEIQTRTTKRRAVLMDAKNYEVERAVKDLLFMVSSFPLEGVPQPEESELRLVRDHYQRQMYLAVLASTKNSIVGLKQRLAAPPKKSGTSMPLSHNASCGCNSYCACTCTLMTAGGISFTELVHDMDKAFFSADIKLQVR
jgi:dynein heavy chain